MAEDSWIEGFRILVRKALQDDPRKAKLARAHANISERTWKRIIGGDAGGLRADDMFRICISLGIPPQEVWDLFSSERPENIRSDLASRLTQLDVLNADAVEQGLSLMDFSTPENAFIIRQLVHALLGPYAKVSPQLTNLGVVDARKCETKYLESYFHHAELHEAFADEPMRLVPPSLMLRVLGSALESQTSALENQIFTEGRSFGLATIPTTAKGYGMAHSAVLHTLTTEIRHLLPDHQLHVLGVTTLLPSMWFNVPALDQDNLHLGEEHEGMREYRRAVQETAQTGAVHFCRLSLSTEDDSLISAGLFRTGNALDQANLYVVHRDLDPKCRDTALTVTEFDHALQQIKSHFKPEFFRQLKPRRRSSHLLVSSSQFKEQPSSNGSILLGSGWRATPLLRHYINELHTTPGCAKHRNVASGAKATGNDLLGRPPLNMTTYTDRFDPPEFDLLLVGCKANEDSPMDWLAALSGDVQWTSGACLLRVITQRPLVKALGDYWLKEYSSGDAMPWTEIASEGRA